MFSKTKLLSLLAAAVAALTAVITYVTVTVPNDPVVVEGGAGKGGSSIAGRAGSATPPPPAASTGFALGTQAWFIDTWSGESVFSSKGVLNSQWLADARTTGAKWFRMMDAHATNNSKQVSWSQRRLPSDANQTAYGAPDGNGDPGIAIEYQIAICNALKSGCWFNIPHLANDDYVTQFAKLVSINLDASLPIIVEYSNETWNGQFSQFAYVNKQGLAAGLGGGNQYYAGGAYTLRRALEIGKIWKATAPRTQLVFAFSGNYDIAAQALKTQYANTRSTTIDLLAVAPYVATSGNNGASFTLAAWKSVVDSLATGNGDSVAAAKRIADANDIKTLGFYEFGSTYYTNAQAFTSHADAQAAYAYMLDKFSAVANGPACHYSLHSTCTSGSCWGGFTPAINAKGKALAAFAALQK